MNNAVKKALLNRDFKQDGNNYRGKFNGFEVSVTNDWERIYVHVYAYATDEQRSNIKVKMNLLNYKYCSWSVNEFGAVLTIMGGMVKHQIDCLFAWLNDATSIIKENGGLGAGYCPICGGELTDSNTTTMSHDGFIFSLHDECLTTVNNKLEEERREFIAAPNNYGKGFCGALLGAIVGAILALVIYFTGFISSISSFVALYVGILLYKKFGGKPNKMMYVIVSVTALGFMILTILLIYAVAAYVGFLSNGIDISITEAFAYVMKDQEVATDFWMDMCFTIMFTILGLAAAIAQEARKNKVKK